MRKLIWGVLVGTLSLAAIDAQAQRTAGSIDQVPGKLKTPEARQAFREQIAGDAAPDRFGLKLPSGVSRQALAGLLVPKSDRLALNSVGMMRWGAEPDTFVAIACTGGELPKSPNHDACQSFNRQKPALNAYVGVVQLAPGGTLRLVARTTQVDGFVDWRRSGLPSQPEIFDEISDGKVPVSHVVGFDLAPYRASPNQPAFGVRVAWDDGYAGGGGHHDALCLFTIVDGTVKQILAAPTSSLLMLAGDWHKDGTRSHDVTDGANILLVTNHITAGHFDLELKSRQSAWRKTFRWSPKSSSYVASNP